MIISRTPFRISFCGGGSDFPSFYQHQPGMVVSTTINKYMYITVNKKFDNLIRASYSITEFAKSPQQLKHELIRESLLMLGIDGGIEITSISDIPSKGTGLGSSSSYTVGLLNDNKGYAVIGQFNYAIPSQTSFNKIAQLLSNDFNTITASALAINNIHYLLICIGVLIIYGTYGHDFLNRYLYVLLAAIASISIIGFLIANNYHLLKNIVSHYTSLLYQIKMNLNRTN